MFRRVRIGTQPGEAMSGFVSETGITDTALLGELETAFKRLAAK
jgi:hypothetical protein